MRNFDLSLFKNFTVKGSVTAQLRAEALNAFNRVQFSALNTRRHLDVLRVISAQANAPRQMQFALKLLS